MKATPMFLGACAFASIAGALSGAATNTTPIQNGGFGMDMLPAPTFAFAAGDTEQPHAALPDHYPIETPAGRYEIGELSTRGLYAQQRFGWREADYAPLPHPVFADGSAEFADATPPAVDAQPTPPPVQPLDLPGPPRGGDARMIDVAAELAVAS